MITKLKEIFNNLLGSLTTGKEGYSARKLSAFIVMMLVVVAHAFWLKNCFLTDDFHLLPEILMIDYTFVATLLGLATWQYVKQSKNAEPNKE